MSECANVASRPAAGSHGRQRLQVDDTGETRSRWCLKLSSRRTPWTYIGNDVGVVHSFAGAGYSARSSADERGVVYPSATSNNARNRRMSAMAAVMESGRDVACGRVTTARYSRIRLRIDRSGPPPASSRASARWPTACAGERAADIDDREWCQRRRYQRPSSPYISCQSERNAAIPRGIMDWHVRRARNRFNLGPATTVMTTSCSPGGTSLGAVPEMR